MKAEEDKNVGDRFTKAPNSITPLQGPVRTLALSGGNFSSATFLLRRSLLRRFSSRRREEEEEEEELEVLRVTGTDAKEAVICRRKEEEVRGSNNFRQHSNSRFRY